jgi:hypothetical protein
MPSKFTVPIRAADCEAVSIVQPINLHCCTIRKGKIRFANNERKQSVVVYVSAQKDQNMPMDALDPT